MNLVLVGDAEQNTIDSVNALEGAFSLTGADRGVECWEVDSRRNRMTTGTRGCDAIRINHGGAVLWCRS
ncbi:hypothetical protein DJ71_05375 [Halorubrum sp. E3]|nr:hypothetical protein DJ71_05375 [Halorubrum sp. E3]